MAQENSITVCKHQKPTLTTLRDKDTKDVCVTTCKVCGKIIKVMIDNKEWVDREEVMKTIEKVIHEQVDAIIKLTKR